MSGFQWTDRLLKSLPAIETLYHLLKKYTLC